MVAPSASHPEPTRKGLGKFLPQPSTPQREPSRPLTRPDLPTRQPSTVAGDSCNEWQWCEWILGLIQQKRKFGEQNSSVFFGSMNQFTVFFEVPGQWHLCNVCKQKTCFHNCPTHFYWPLGVFWLVANGALESIVFVIGFCGVRMIDVGSCKAGSLVNPLTSSYNIATEHPQTTYVRSISVFTHT